MKPGRQERGASFPARKVSGHSGRNPCRLPGFSDTFWRRNGCLPHWAFLSYTKNGQGWGNYPLRFPPPWCIIRVRKDGERESFVRVRNLSLPPVAESGFQTYPTLPKFSPHSHLHSHTHCRAHTTAQNTFSPKQSPPHQPTTARQSPPHSKENTAPAKS